MSTQRTLFIHIGDHKTGSSFLQSCFANSMEELAAQGIRYPAPPALDRVMQGGTSFGNGAALMPYVAGATHRTEKLEQPTDTLPHVAYSAEILLVSLVRNESVGALVAAAREAGFERVNFLLFIRDPVGHHTSLWQQSVKAGGNTNSLNRGAAAFARPKFAAAFLAACEEHPEVTVTVRNYSVVRRNVRGVAEAWLGVPSGTLSAPPVAVVNRSFTRAELELQMALNRYIGRNHILVSPLCNGLPDIKVDEQRPSLEHQKAIWEGLQPAIQEVNARIEPEHHYRCDVDAEERTVPDALELSPQQVHIIGEALGKEIARLRIQLDGDLDLLDDYLKVETSPTRARQLVLGLIRRFRELGETEKVTAFRERLDTIDSADGNDEQPDAPTATERPKRDAAARLNREKNRERARQRRAARGLRPAEGRRAAVRAAEE